MTDQISTGLSEGRVGRYVLEDLAAETSESQLWRASDPALNRPVGARLIPIDHPRLAEVNAAARAAASVHDHRIIQVLDVIETPTHLAIITEWVGGQPWSQILLSSPGPQEAVIVAYEVGRALQAAHAQGVTHGRLRPSSAIITETNQVRLRGLAVDAALFGIAPGQDPVAADLHGVGAMLYVGLTGHWPCPESHNEWVDRLPVVGLTGKRLPSPSEVVSGVPSELSKLASACLLPSIGPPTRKPFTNLDQAVISLSRAMNGTSAVEKGSAPNPTSSAMPERIVWRLAMAVSACIIVAVGLAVGSNILGPSASAPPPAEEPTPPSSGPGQDVVGDPVQISVASASDFDPDGSDHSENPQLVGLALDGDLNTAWQTVNYRASTMAPKSGTGLLLDLGLTRPITAVQLDLLGSGATVEVRVADQPGSSPANFTEFAGAVAAPAEISLRAPIPVHTRYVLVWLKNLPFQNGTYVGGLREVKIWG